MFTKMLVAYDGSDGAIKAMKTGIDLARSLDRDLHAVIIEEELPGYAGTIDEFDAIKEQKDAYYLKLAREVRERAKEEGVTLHTYVLPGHEIRTITIFVKQDGFDLLIIGSHGHSQFYERFIGSTAQGLMVMSPCSVLVVK